ncbi:MAG TPA: lecithin retinol acyltransferase family protein [Rhizomicrobium sp.]|jgi:hypothetical protein|nr:lecithin retinol acyltransferase family protein [Rhizomicrobium sp.]
MGVFIYPRPGTVVYIVILGLFRHKGIVSDRWWNGKPTVIANTPRLGVAELQWDVFANGQMVRIDGYPSKLPPFAVLFRARRLIGTQYSLGSFNCEHFVNYCHGLRPDSPQVVAAVGAAIVVGLFMLAA